LDRRPTRRTGDPGGEGGVGVGADPDEVAEHVTVGELEGSFPSECSDELGEVGRVVSH
jgi:hypothetical protein